MAQPLDRRRPLWEMWVIEGASAGRWGLICKLHHCMVDGISAGDLLAVLLDPEPRTPASAPDRWQPSPEPSSASVLAHTLSETASGPARHLRQARALLGAPRDTAREAITLAAGLSSLRGLLGASTARSLNGPLRAERQWVQARASLADVKTIRRALGGTVNDVLLAAVSGGFRALLLGRGEPLPPELMVRTLVPLSLRTQDARGIPDNRVSALFAELPVGLQDPVERLHAITITLDALKRSGQAVAGSALTQLSGLAPPPLVALGARALTRLPQHRLQTDHHQHPRPPAAAVPVRPADARDLPLRPARPRRAHRRRDLLLRRHPGLWHHRRRQTRHRHPHPRRRHRTRTRPTTRPSHTLPPAGPGAPQAAIDLASRPLRRSADAVTLGKRSSQIVVMPRRP